MSFNKKRIDNTLKLYNKISGKRLHELSKRARVTRKAKAILADCTHTLFSHFKLLPSGRRYALPRYRTNRLKNSSESIYIVALNGM